MGKSESSQANSWMVVPSTTMTIWSKSETDA
jgi:hypothetical protein